MVRSAALHSTLPKALVCPSPGALSTDYMRENSPSATDVPSPLEELMEHKVVHSWVLTCWSFGGNALGLLATQPPTWNSVQEVSRARQVWGGSVSVS